MHPLGCTDSCPADYLFHNDGMEPHPDPQYWDAPTVPGMYLIAAQIEVENRYQGNQQTVSRSRAVRFSLFQLRCQFLSGFPIVGQRRAFAVMPDLGVHAVLPAFVRSDFDGA